MPQPPSEPTCRCNDPDHDSINAERAEARLLRREFIRSEDLRQELMRKLEADGEFTQALRQSWLRLDDRRLEPEGLLESATRADPPAVEVDDAQRPMTLDEWVKELPICHSIHAELLELKRAADWGPKAASYSKWGLSLLLLGNILWRVGHHFNL